MSELLYDQEIAPASMRPRHKTAENSPADSATAAASAVRFNEAAA